MSLATAACSALVAPTPTATLTVLPTPKATRPPPTATPLPAPGSIRPPTADLTINGQAQTSAIGTYCWRDLDTSSGVGLCADMIGIMTPADPLRVPAGPFLAEFSLPLDEPPTSAALWVYPATGPVSPISGTETLAWQPALIDPTSVPLEFNPSVALDLDDGVYVIALFAQWQDIGDVMYGFLVQVGEAAPATTPAAEAVLPASCVPTTAAETAFVDPGGRYCLLYPSAFHTGDLTPDRAGFYGPPLDASVAPVFATLTIEALGTDGGKPLAAVVQTYLYGTNPQGAAPALDRQPSQWGGEPAEVIYGLPGLTPSRQVIVLHGGTVYHIVLLPYDVTAPPALPDVENVWAVVSQSFTFLPSP